MSQGDADRSAPTLTEDGVPDPGFYSDYFLEKVSTGSQVSANKKIRDSALGFNSDVARCVDSGFEDRSGLRGPGAYDFYHLYGTAVDGGRAKDTTTRGTTAFTKSAPRCGYVRKMETPGAGNYEPINPRLARGSTQSKLGSSAFAGNTARCAAELMSEGSAGPETYDLSQMTMSNSLAARANPRSPPFGGSSRRIT